MDISDKIESRQLLLLFSDSKPTACH